MRAESRQSFPAFGPSLEMTSRRPSTITAALHRPTKDLPTSIDDEDSTML
jgi:hypothetical protein